MIERLHVQEDPGAPLVIYISRATADRLRDSARAAGIPAWKHASALFAELMFHDAAAHDAAVSSAPTPFRKPSFVPA